MELSLPDLPELRDSKRQFVEFVRDEIRQRDDIPYWDGELKQSILRLEYMEGCLATIRQFKKGEISKISFPYPELYELNESVLPLLKRLCEKNKVPMIVNGLERNGKNILSGRGVRRSIAGSGSQDSSITANKSGKNL